MSIQSEITRLSGNVSDALDAIEAKGVTIPTGANSDNLANLIGQISGSGGNYIISVDSDSAVGSAVVGTATTVAPNYTPSGDVVQAMEDVEFMSGATVALNYSFANSILTITGLTVTPITVEKTIATGTPIFVGSGTKLIVEEEST